MKKKCTIICTICAYLNFDSAGFILFEVCFRDVRKYAIDYYYLHYLLNFNRLFSMFKKYCNTNSYNVSVETTLKRETFKLALKEMQVLLFNYNPAVLSFNYNL